MGCGYLCDKVISTTASIQGKDNQYYVKMGNYGQVQGDFTETASKGPAYDGLPGKQGNYALNLGATYGASDLERVSYSAKPMSSGLQKGPMDNPLC